MIKEIWKDIPNYEGLYQASNLGKIKSLYRNKILSPCKDKDGYLKVLLYKNKKRKNISVHRLIALTFLDNYDNFPVVNHKDENKQNNRVDNLEWCTIFYNNRYKRTKKINQYDMNKNFIKQWESARDIQRELNFDHSNITTCCKKNIKMYGYYWSYTNKEVC